MKRGSLLGLLLLLVLPQLAHAGTFFSDDFENHLWTASNGNPWDTGACGSQNFLDGCNAVIDTQQAHSGTHVLHSHYSGPTGSGTYYDRHYPATEEIYWRFWYRTHAFTYANVGTKHMNFSDGATNPSFWLYHLGGGRRYFEMDCEGCQQAGPPGDSNAYSDLQFLSKNPTNINDDQWYCVEGHIKLNTPGQPNGVIELWVNGTQQFSYSSVTMRGPNVSNPGNNSSLSQFKQIRHYTQDGSGYDNRGEMYYDDLAVGNSKIGCGATFSTTTSSPTTGTPPASPTNLVVN